MKFETKAIRIQTSRTKEREHSTPLFPTSSFVFDNAEQMRRLFADEEEGNIYSRFSNPNCSEFEDKMANLEKVECALATATGMAAIAGSLLALLRHGDHILCASAVFGSTYRLLSNYLTKYGIETTFINSQKPEEWEESLKKSTKVLFVESPSNPGLDIIDLSEASRFAQEHHLTYIVDNCFCTPYIQNPVDFGADLILHSATKFIDGQGRVLGGVICGAENRLRPIKKFLRNTGPALSPFNAWILSKSLETLPVRMDRHCSNALFLAQELTKHPKIRAIKYPFLETHPQHTLAKKQMKLGGGLLTFDLNNGASAGTQFLNHIKMISLSSNLGDTRTIATHPATSTHAKLPTEERQKLGITDGLIRVSVGLEHREDILEDILQALDQI